jgi:hypothetical protein
MRLHETHRLGVNDLVEMQVLTKVEGGPLGIPVFEGNVTLRHPKKDTEQCGLNDVRILAYLS